MVKLCFDYGHGGVDLGASHNGRKESDDVLSLGRAVASEVRRHGIIVHETRTSDVTMSLKERGNFENRNTYDYFISFHRNAYEPEQAKGVETYTNLDSVGKAKGLAKRVQTSLLTLGFVDRGLREANFYVLRETKAPAVLVELGFIDSTNDNNIFDSKRNEIIKTLATAILAEVGVIYVEPSAPAKPISGQTLYRVMAGSYQVRENAEDHIQKLRNAGFDATILILNK